MSTRARQPRGVPIGGEFASTQRPAAGLGLVPTEGATTLEQVDQVMREHPALRGKQLVDRGSDLLVVGFTDAQIYGAADEEGRPRLTPEASQAWGALAGVSQGRAIRFGNGVDAAVLARAERWSRQPAPDPVEMMELEEGVEEANQRLLRLLMSRGVTFEHTDEDPLPLP